MEMIRLMRDGIAQTFTIRDMGEIVAVSLLIVAIAVIGGAAAGAF